MQENILFIFEYDFEFACQTTLSNTNMNELKSKKKQQNHAFQRCYFTVRCDSTAASTSHRGQSVFMKLRSDPPATEGWIFPGQRAQIQASSGPQPTATKP